MHKPESAQENEMREIVMDSETRISQFRPDDQT